MPRIERADSGWRIVSDDGVVLRDNLTNAQAWRNLDLIQNEPVSAAQVEKDFKEPAPRASSDEMQEFFSGLLQIEEQRGYKSGWAWHQFCEKFGFQPEGLHRGLAKPTKQVWGWVNRKAIAGARK
jgi:hypothetical protein